MNYKSCYVSQSKLTKKHNLQKENIFLMFLKPIVTVCVFHKISCQMKFLPEIQFKTGE